MANASGQPLALAVRVPRGPIGFDHEYAGFDMLLVANLNDQPLYNPQLGIGEELVPLQIGGFFNDPVFGLGGTGDQVLSELAAGAVYATLIPESAAINCSE